MVKKSHLRPTQSFLLRGSLLLSGTALLIVSGPEQAFAFESVKFAIEEICGHIQGSLGGLLMTAAGVGALAAAAFGNLKAMQGVLVAGIGAAAVSSVLGLYFGAAADICSGQTQGEIGATVQGRQVIGGFEVQGARQTEAQQRGISQAAIDTVLGNEVRFQDAPPAQDLANEDEETDPFLQF